MKRFPSGALMRGATIAVLCGLALGACQSGGKPAPTAGAVSVEKYGAESALNYSLPEIATLVEEPVRPIETPLALTYGAYAAAPHRGQLTGEYRSGRKWVPMEYSWRGSSSATAVGDLLSVAVDVDEVSFHVGDQRVLPADTAYAVRILMAPDGDVRHVTFNHVADGKRTEGKGEGAAAIASLFQNSPRFPAEGVRTGDRLPIEMDGLLGTGMSIEGSARVEGLSRYKGRDVIVILGACVVTLPSRSGSEAELSAEWISLVDRATAMPLYEVGTMHGPVSGVWADLSFVRELLL